MRTNRRTPQRGSMLFDPGRHEPLLELEWDASRAREAVRAIVEDLEETLGSGIAWPAHPLDEVDEPRTGQKTLYLGASGALWAMWYLEREGAVELRVKPSDLKTVERTVHARRCACSRMWPR